jgi:hypothetical protein
MKAQALGDTSSLEFMRGRRILEVNPDHPIIKDLNVRPFNSVLNVDHFFFSLKKKGKRNYKGRSFSLLILMELRRGELAGTLANTS